MSMQNFKLYILGTIRTCGRRYIPPETKLLKFCWANIAKIMFLVSDKNVVFVFGVRFTFLFDSKNSRAQEYSRNYYFNEHNILYLSIYQGR